MSPAVLCIFPSRFNLCTPYIYVCSEKQGKTLLCACEQKWEIVLHPSPLALWNGRYLKSSLFITIIITFLTSGKANSGPYVGGWVLEMFFLQMPVCKACHFPMQISERLLLIGELANSSELADFHGKLFAAVEVHQFQVEIPRQTEASIGGGVHVPCSLKL